MQFVGERQRTCSRKSVGLIQEAALPAIQQKRSRFSIAELTETNDKKVIQSRINRDIFHQCSGIETHRRVISKNRNNLLFLAHFLFCFNRLFRTLNITMGPYEVNRRQ